VEERAAVDCPYFIHCFNKDKISLMLKSPSSVRIWQTRWQGAWRLLTLGGGSVSVDALAVW